MTLWSNGSIGATEYSSDCDLSDQTDVITVTNDYGSFTDERVSSYHYCLPD